MEAKQNSSDHKLPPLSTTYHPWFIAQNVESGDQIFHTIGNTQYYYQCRINELHGRRIRACFHGWMILSNHSDSVLWSLWNPLTSKLIRLPPLVRKEGDSYECCLSSPPDKEGSVLLLTSTETPTIVFRWVDCKRKRLKWTKMSYAKQIMSICGEDGVLECPTCCNGKVYAMTLGRYNGFVIHVDVVVKGKEVVISLVPFVKVPCTSYSRCPSGNKLYAFQTYLKGSCTELFYIRVCFSMEMRIGDVYLFKLDITSMKWEEILDLKDATFFLELASDNPTCYYASKVDSELGGYVHILDKSGEKIYSFYVKDRTKSISSMPCLVQESQASAWAMLEWRLEVDGVESNKHEEEDKDTEIIVSSIKDNYKSESDMIITGESHLLNIPVHILETIMDYCIGSEYMRFRATCKHCYLATPPIQWSSETTLRRLQTYSLVSPWLLVLDNYRGIITLIDPTRDDRYFIKKPQELKGDYQIYCSRYGWLLMYQTGEPMVFFNPFTSNIRKLPVAPYAESFCFSAPPTSHDCLVVGFTKCEQWPIFIHFVSKSIWYTFSLNFGGNDPYSFRFPIFNGRDVYALCNNKGLDVFKDMAKDDYSWEAVVDEAPISDCESLSQYFLSICDQHIFLVIVGEFGETVEVFKVDESTEEWEKIDGLGKHMIYISNTSCICLEAKSPEMENKIYFPRLLHKDSTKIVFYSLETCKYHTFDGQNIQESFGADLLRTEYHCHPHTWIEPSWS